MSIDRSVLLKSVQNSRELGGYPAAGGKRVKSGVLLRTANLSSITPEDIQILKDRYRVSDIIDFRMEMEKTGFEDPVIDGICNTHLDVIDFSDMDSEGMSDVDMSKLDIVQLVEMSEKIGMLSGDMYIGFLENDKGKDAYARFFRILLSADPDKAVLWHCTSGKDRTGLAAMLILSVLGTEESVIMEDYLLTNEYNAQRIAGTKQFLKAKGCDDDFVEKAVLVFDAVDRRFMETVMEYLKKKYGSVLGYIRSELNISGEEMAALKEKYTV